MTLYTIGYEGSDIENFLETLTLFGITHLADIRDFPGSRKKGFSKNRLNEALSDRGISYTHFKALGDPKKGREAMRRGDRETFLQVFNAHMQTADAQAALVGLEDVVESETSVLLCYERQHKDCHRSIVAAAIKRRKRLEVRHIGVNAETLAQRKLVDAGA